jgi:putative phage-type endonuclease
MFIYNNRDITHYNEYKYIICLYNRYINIYMVEPVYHVETMETSNVHYITMFNMLNDCDNLIKLCGFRLIQAYELHIEDLKYGTIDENIIEYTKEQIMVDLKPIMNEFIGILSGKDATVVTGLEYIQYYNSISNSINECLEDTLNILYNKKTIICREYQFEYSPKKYQFIFNNTKTKNEITETLQYLQSITQHEQRTDEWYDIRHNCITASSAWKILDSQVQKDSFIKSKLSERVYNTNNGVSIDTAFHHGHKYEPLSIMIYERINKTKVGEFGCIKHKTHGFIGASPDGINVDPISEKYGTLLEIKNVVSREITGIPKKEYWVQMQMQMEVCDLDYCDFLENKFVEYESEEQFLEDLNIDSVEKTVEQNNNNLCENHDNFENNEKGTHILKNKENKYTGLIVMFYINGEPLYEYCPLSNTRPQKILEWKDYIIEKYLSESPTNMWVNNIYWKCEKYSCICVERNKAWFNTVLPYFRKIWECIENKRKNETTSTQLNNGEKTQDGDILLINSNIDNKKSENKKKTKQKKASSGSDIFSGFIGKCLIKLD